MTKSDNEDVFKKVKEVAFKLQLSPLTHEVVIAVHRLPAKPDKVPRIIICLARQTTKDQWLLGTKPDVFVMENIPKQNRAFLRVTKGVRFCYVGCRNGSILVRRQNGDRAIVVRNEADLLYL